MASVLSATGDDQLAMTEKPIRDLMSDFCAVIASASEPAAGDPRGAPRQMSPLAFYRWYDWARQRPPLGYGAEELLEGRNKRPADCRLDRPLKPVAGLCSILGEMRETASTHIK